MFIEANFPLQNSFTCIAPTKSLQDTGRPIGHDIYWGNIPSSQKSFPSQWQTTTNMFTSWSWKKLVWWDWNALRWSSWRPYITVISEEDMGIILLICQHWLVRNMILLERNLQVMKRKVTSGCVFLNSLSIFFLDGGCVFPLPKNDKIRISPTDKWK